MLVYNLIKDIMELFFWVDFQDYILIDSSYKYRSEYLDYFSNKLSEKEFLIINKKGNNKEALLVNADELKKTIPVDELKKINTKSLCLYWIDDFERSYANWNVKFSKINIIKNFQETRNPAIFEKILSYSLNWINSFNQYKKPVIVKNDSDTLLDDIAQGFRYSRASSKTEIYDYLKLNYEKLFNSKIDNWNNYILYQDNLWEDINFNLEIVRKEVYLNINIKESSNIYNDKDEIKNLRERILIKLKENEAKIIWSFNDARLKKLDFLESFYSLIKDNDKIIKEKNILNNLSLYINTLSNIDLKFESFWKEWISLFEDDDYFTDLFDSYSNQNEQIIFANEDIYKDKDFNEQYFLIIKKARKYIGRDLEVVFNKIEYDRRINEGFRNWKTIKNLPANISLNNEELTNIFENIKKEDLSKNISNDSNKIKYSSSFSLTKWINYLSINEKEQIPFENQRDRSQGYAKSLYNVSILKNIKTQINNIDIKQSNLSEIKELIGKYKLLADELKNNYSGEWWLIITKDVISSIISYCSTNTELNESDELYFKNTLYKNFWNLLDASFSFYENKSDETEKAKYLKTIIAKYSTFKSNSVSLFQLWEQINHVIKELENLWVDFDKAIVEINNIEWVGAYFTPNHIKQILKPFIVDNIYLWQVSIIDPCVWKGSLLDFISWENIKAFWNDVNSLSIDVLNLTNSFDYDSALNTNDIDEIWFYINNSKIITNKSSLSDLTKINYKFDILISNPPYLSDYVWREKILELKEKWLNNAFNNWRVNLVELSYRWLADKIKLWGLWVNISSARWIWKLEQKFKLHDNTYLVPLYRIWINWNPFKTEGVKLAPISISWDSIYVYNNEKNSFDKWDWDAEFFVTIYTRLEKSDQVLFDNSCPTLIVNNNDLVWFSNALCEELQNDAVLYNLNKYKHYYNLNLLKDFYNFDKENALINTTLTELMKKENLQNNDVILYINESKTFSDYIENKSLNDKRIWKLKLIKKESYIKDELDYIFNEFNKINPAYYPLLRESLKPLYNENSLKQTIISNLWLIDTNYSFRVDYNEKKIVESRWKYYYKDMDITWLIKYPFPFSLQVIPTKTYNFLLNSYLENTPKYYIEEKIFKIINIVSYFKNIEDLKNYKTVYFIWKLGVDNIDNFLKKILNDSEKIKNFNEKKLEDYLSELQVYYKFNKDNVAIFLLFLITNNNEFNNLNKNIWNTNFQKMLNLWNYKIFKVWNILKINNTTLRDNLKVSIKWIQNYIEKYSIWESTTVFSEIINKNYLNNIDLLKDVWEVLIDEFNNWNDYFNILEKFKESKSIILKEFSQIQLYSKINELSKLDIYFDMFKDIDEKISRIKYIINNNAKKITQKWDYKDLIGYLKQKWLLISWWTEYKYLNEDFYIKNIKNYFLEKYNFWEKDKVENMIIDLKTEINYIKNPQIRKLYETNISILETNLKIILNNNVYIEEEKLNISVSKNELRNINLSRFEDESFFYKIEKIIIDLWIKDNNEEKEFNIWDTINVKEIFKWLHWKQNNLENLNSFETSIFFDEVKNKHEFDISLKREIINNTKELKLKSLKSSINESDPSNDNMLLSVYSDETKNNILSEFTNKTCEIENIINYYKELEISVSNEKSKNSNKDEECNSKNFEIINYAKFMTSNLDDVEKIIFLWAIKDWYNSINNYIKEKNPAVAIFLDNKDSIDNLFIQKKQDYEKFWSLVADSIIASLWVKSNYIKLYTNILSDIEWDILKQNNNYNFKKDFIDFKNYINEISPYEEKIKLSNTLASNIDFRQLLNKKNILFQDLIQIEWVEEYIESNNIDDLGEEEKMEIITQDKLFIKNTKIQIDQNIKILWEALDNFNIDDFENKNKLLPTFVQTKALYKFSNSLKENAWNLRIINQSEVWTGKTFTMPFYEKILDDYHQNDKTSFKIFITEANLVSNTTKSLIENWISPNKILEWKMSNESDIIDIIKFSKNKWSHLILSSSSLSWYSEKSISLLSNYLKRNTWNIYLYCDEATFLKNTESNSYSWFKYLESQLSKTKKLKLVNLLTATPVNNDNWDFLYLFNALNKKEIYKIIGKINNSNKWINERELLKIYDIIKKLPNFNLWEKYVKHVQEWQPMFYYIPNLVLFLELLRKGNTNFNIDDSVEIKSRFWWDKKEYISLKKYYEWLWIFLPRISESDFNNRKFILNEPIYFHSTDKELSETLINFYKDFNIINFDRNLNSLWYNWKKSKLLKTYYWLNPSLIEVFIIENFIQKLEEIQNYKKFVSNYQKALRKGFWEDLKNEFKLEGKYILNNLLLQVASNIWLHVEESSYDVSKRVKKGFKEIEEIKAFPIFSLNTNALIKEIEKDDWNQYLLNNKFIDRLFSTIDIISYSNYKQTIKNIEVLKVKQVKENLIKKEQVLANKYIENITGVLSYFICQEITSKTSSEWVKAYIKDFINHFSINDITKTIENTYKDNPSSFIKRIEGLVNKNDYMYRQIESIIFDLSKNDGFSGFSERKYLIQLLEDFNSPLSALFIEDSINNLINDIKTKNISEINITDIQKEEIKEYILSKWNTLSWVLQKVSIENSKKEFNSFIMVNFVNTVYNLEKEVKKLNKNTYFITWKDVKTSKDKLKIINDFDKLDEFGKVLISTTKSVEKGLSIFNSLKGYTTVWDENAWALTQRLWRFRTLMESQIKKLEIIWEKIVSKQLDFGENRNNKIMNNIELLKNNTKEFFIIWNKLSQWLLQRSESKNILLQKVNATSLFNWIIDFNDNYYWVEWWQFNVDNIMNSIKIIITNEKETFYNKLKLYSNWISWDELKTEIQFNIEKNISKNLENMSLIETLKSDKIDKLEKINNISL